MSDTTLVYIMLALSILTLPTMGLVLLFAKLRG